MRSAPMLLAILALVVAPTASAASPAELKLSAPSGPFSLGPGGTVVPVNVTLNMDHFSCASESEFVVQLATAGSGVVARLENETVVFHVPAQPYLVQGYSETRTFNVTIQPDGTAPDGYAEVSATFTSDGGACFAPGGFTPAFANATLRTMRPADETDDGNATLGEANATSPTPATNVTKPTNRGPSGNTDVIGDYRGPSESTDGGNSVPAPGVLVLALGVVAAAILARRKA